VKDLGVDQVLKRIL